MQKIVEKLKINLGLATNRLKLLREKKKAIGKAERKEISRLLEQDETMVAKIRVEKIIQEDYIIEALELLEQYCRRLQNRLILIDQSKQLDDSTMEVICSIIYSSGRVNVKEFATIKDIFTSLYGREFVGHSLDNTNLKANEQLVAKLNICEFDPLLIKEYLREISRSYGIKWVPSDEEPEDESSEDDDGNGGGAKESEAKEEEKEREKEVEARHSKVNVPQQKVRKNENDNSVDKESSTRDRADNSSHSSNKAQTGDEKKVSDSAGSANQVPTMDELMKRLEALKRN